MKGVEFWSFGGGGMILGLQNVWFSFGDRTGLKLEVYCFGVLQNSVLASKGQKASLHFWTPPIFWNVLPGANDLPKFFAVLSSDCQVLYGWGHCGRDSGARRCRWGRSRAVSCFAVAAKKADGLSLVTQWLEFRKPCELGLSAASWGIPNLDKLW